MFKKLLKIHLLSLFIFLIFRIILLLSNSEKYNHFSDDLINAFVMGLRFDTVINCYILALPTLIWTIFFITKKNNKFLNKAIYYYCAVMFSLAYAVNGFNIPYFNQFFNHLDKSAFLWIDSPDFIIGMVTKDIKIWGYFIPFILVLVIFQFLLRKIFNSKEILHFHPNSLIFRIFISVFCIGLTFLGIRGRWEGKSPIRIGTAYFSNNAFLNKLGLNPNFTLIQSLLQKKSEWKNLMPKDNAFSITRQSLWLPHSTEKTILENVKPDSQNLGKPNIVLVLMESMTANNLKHFGNQQNITPVLDNLIGKSIFFENTYSAGIHTFNGIFSSLYSFPALWNEHTMKTIKNYPNNSIKVFAKAGYNTAYFTTHDGQFDNVEGFLMANDFNKVYAQKDYPSSEIKSNLGVSDDYLFRFSIKEINKLYQEKKPFFVTMMTASNHSPIIIPEYFTPKTNTLQTQAVEYSDWSIGQFLKDAEKQDWFKNTIFVFVADHGNSIDTTYDMSLSYNHIPLFFYAPHLLKNPEIRKDFILQIDILPSLLGLTDISYTKENLGINIWKNQRDFAYFSADDKIGVINNEFFYIYRKDGRENLYKYRNQDLTDYIQRYPDLAKKMKNYAFGNIQTSYEISKKLK